MTPNRRRLKRRIKPPKDMEDDMGNKEMTNVIVCLDQNGLETRKNDEILEEMNVEKEKVHNEVQNEVQKETNTTDVNGDKPRSYANMVKKDEVLVNKELMFIALKITEDGQNMGFYELRYNVRRMWGKYGLKEVTVNASGVNLFKFKDENDPRGDQGLYTSKNSTRSPREITLNLLLYLIVHKQLLLWFRWISFDYRITIGFGSIAGSLDHVNHVIRLPVERGINRVIRLVLGIFGINHYELVALLTCVKYTYPYGYSKNHKKTVKNGQTRTRERKSAQKPEAFYEKVNIKENMGDDVDIITLTIEQYMALIQDDIRPGVVKPEIGNVIEFEINSNFIRELRCKLFVVACVAIQESLHKSTYLARILVLSRINEDKEVEQILLRVLPFTLTGAAKRWVDKHTPGVGSIPGMTPTQALMVIKTMTDHSQKWHDGTSSKNISSISNADGLAAIVSKLDNLGRDMKKLKENVHAIQVGCQIYKGPHLDKECPLNKEVKQLEEVKYGESGRSAPFNESNGAKFFIGPPGYYTRTDNRPPYGENRPSLEELMNKHHEDQTTNVTPSSSIWQCKVVNNDHETQHRPISSRKLNNKEGWMTKDIQCQLPPKELNPRNFTLPCTIGNFNFYGMADLGASVNVMPRNIFEHLRLANLRNTNMPVEMADMTKKAPLGMPFLATIHAEIDVFDKEISLRTDNNRVSYDMEKKDHNFIIPTEKIFVIKSDLDNRPQPLACSDNQSRKLRDSSPDDSLQDQSCKKIKIELDQHIPKAHFCKPIKQTINKQTKMWPTCDPTKGMCDKGNKIYGVSRVKTLRFWYYNYDNERKNITGVGLSFPDYLLAKYGKYQTDSLIWDDTYAEWCNTSLALGTSSQEYNNLRPINYTFREWILIKVGHTDISEPVKKALLKLWLIDCFLDKSGIIKDPLSSSFYDYKWVFDLEIDQLADEYKLGIGKKGHMLDKIWEYCKDIHRNNTYWWHDHGFEEEERDEMGIKIEKYDLPEVQVETFEAKKYPFKSGQTFVCVTKEVDDALTLGRKNGSRFIEMIRNEFDIGAHDET
ncbi:hypothetical protein Tco_0541297 [Tanacetum coccineum]